MTALNNRVTAEVEEGDVAIFDLGDIWHVAYVEKVHQDGQGAATAIDVSEMNLGGQISLDEFKKRWHANEAGEWKRALCCGVTKKYDQRSIRKKISLNSVEQVWSPDIPADQEVNVGHNDDSLLDKVRETLNRFIQFTGREL
ncbi:MAG: CHAP domain-containing protein [Geobacteraceae bacterium]|nr:CHAP domain-containing protein [Geobacteraceae bacterium]